MGTLEERNKFDVQRWVHVFSCNPCHGSESRDPAQDGVIGRYGSVWI